MMPEELFLDSTLTTSKFESEKWIQLNAETNELAVSWGDQSRENMSLSKANSTKNSIHTSLLRIDGVYFAILV